MHSSEQRDVLYHPGMNSASAAFKALDIVGKDTGVLNAGVAIYDAYNTVSDPNATTEQKVGAVVNATF